MLPPEEALQSYHIPKNAAQQCCTGYCIHGQGVLKSATSSGQLCSNELEGVDGSVAVLPLVADPPLVSSLGTDDVEVAALDSGLDEEVASTLITVSGPHEHLVEIGGHASVLVNAFGGVHQGGGAGLPRLEATLGIGGQVPRGLAKEGGGPLGEELAWGAVASDGALVGLLLRDQQVGHHIEVVLVPDNLARGLFQAFRGLPLRGDVHLEAFADIWNGG